MTAPVQPSEDRAEDLEIERERQARVQSALYRIAETASAAHDMGEFYASIHAIVGELMYAENFYVALYDEDRQRVSYPFHVDELDEEWPAPNVWDEMGSGQATGTTQKNAPRQPMYCPRKLPMGAAIVVARALPPLSTASARGTSLPGTIRIMVAADIDQKPPTAMPTRARPIMKTG